MRFHISQRVAGGFNSLVLGRDFLQVFNHRAVQTRNIQYDYWKISNDRPRKVKGYYILLPPVPDETVSNNTFLSNIARGTDWPPLESADARELYDGTIRMHMEYGASVWELIEMLKTNPSFEKSFDNVLLPLFGEEYDLHYTYSVAMLKLLTGWPGSHIDAVNNDILALNRVHSHELSSRFHERLEIRDAIIELYQKEQEKGKQNREISATGSTELKQYDEERLDYWDNRILENQLLFVKLSGLEKFKVDKKITKVLPVWNASVNKYLLTYLFYMHGVDCENRFVTSNRDEMRYAPRHVLRLFSLDEDPEVGPWMSKLHPNFVYPFLRYCNSRRLRSAIWDRWISKASYESGLTDNNSINIEEIRNAVQGRAKLLGFKTAADYTLSFMMAGSVTTVRDFIDILRSRMIPQFANRIKDWTSFAEHHEKFNAILPFDLYYLSRREAEQRYRVDFLELSNYFPFDATLSNIFQITSDIFGIDFQDISNSNLERCHPSVKIYSVTDRNNNEHLGRIYFDLFQRPSKLKDLWYCNLARTTNKARNWDKIVFLIGSAEDSSSDGGPPVLHFEQLGLLLFNLGRAIQYLLSRSPYFDLAICDHHYGDSDAMDFIPNFMKFFMFKPNLLKAMSGLHTKTGEYLHDDDALAYSLALSRSTFWEAYRRLFWSDFDLTLFTVNWEKNFWLDLYHKKHREYFPFSMEFNNYQPCSFAPLFVKAPLVGKYYGKLWSEMLAFDTHDTFNQEKNVSATGERLKTTMLNFGGGELQGYLYNRFQGRDPAVGAICDFYDPPEDMIEDGEAERRFIEPEQERKHASGV